MLRLVSGTGLAQLIAILAAPILTRLYAEAFGVAALFASLTGILGVLACMRYELSIVLPDNDREAANLLGISLGFSVLIALLTVPIIVFAGPQVLQWVRMPELVPYLWLVPIMVLIHGVFTALNYWNTRTKHFTRLSIARVTSSVASTSATLGALFADDDGLAETMRAICTHGGVRRHHYPKCLHEQPVFAGPGYRWGDFPESERASREVLSLPMHPGLTEREQERVIVALQGVLEARASFHPGAVARSGAGGGGPIGVQS
ncbi:MAG: hypothetical protein EA420_17650 [Candidatus Competibacteraceae bacterium]|nr:MAG: hypothetical protein EA420_17650 [Candidatus Competibacteraceae bacterium]